MIAGIIFTLLGLGYVIGAPFVYRRQAHKCGMCLSAAVICTVVGALLTLFSVAIIVTEVAR